MIYIDSGGGHRAAANALSEVIRQQQRPWDVEMVSIQDLLDRIDFVRHYTGIRFQDVYNIMLRNGWTLGTAQLIPMMHGVIRASHDAQVHEIEKYWEKRRPDLVVSLIPHYNRALWEALQHTCPGVPYVTLLTDIADYPPHFWIEKLDQWVICGSTKAVDQAKEIGIPTERVLQASGMILSPRFYQTMQVDRAEERVSLGLKPDVPVGLVLFGGEGSTEMVKIAKALNEAESKVQLILICGKNEAVAGELKALAKQIPMVVEGFTKEIPLFMEISDFFIGKPGPGSLSEAFAKKLPVIVQRNAWTMAHERYNTEWIEELGAGIVIENFGRDLPAAVKHLLDPVRYEQYRERAASTRNMAVFEIPDMLSDILAKPSSQHLLDGASDFAAQSHPNNAHSV